MTWRQFRSNGTADNAAGNFLARGTRRNGCKRAGVCQLLSIIFREVSLQKYKRNKACPYWSRTIRDDCERLKYSRPALATVD